MANPPYYLRNPYSVGKSSARQSGREWTLTQDQYKQIMGNRKCYYCGWDLNMNAGGLDRVDSSGHYTPDNVVPCCRSCNSLKRAMPKAVFMAERIHEAYNTAEGSPGGEA